MEALTLPLLAVVAGFISFSSPCCLPLVPGYLSYVSSLPTAELDENAARRTTVRASLLFVAGFTTVFTGMGIGATLLGSTLLRHEETIVKAFGVLIILLALSTLGVLRIPVLQRERRIDLARIPRGPAWAYPMGMAFAAGWTPCIGPILATVLTTVSMSDTVWWGGALLALYSVGLGVPFVLLALGVSRMQRSMDWLRRNSRKVEIAGGILLLVVGVLFVTGQWSPLFRPMQRWFAELGWPPI